MRLSTRGAYGVRAMIDLALTSSNGPVSIQSVAQRQEISISYLEQIFNRLRHSGLIRSMRGPGGGYMLDREAGTITVGDIVRAVEQCNYVSSVSCVNPHERGKGCGGQRESECAARVLWQHIGARIEELFDSITLEQLCNDTYLLKLKSENKNNV
ncbi:MAG: Rrf2 family transcriptional regulator [bacterium]